MNEVASQALEKLLRLTENAVGKGSDKFVTIRFSEKSFPAYSALPTHAEKQACNADLILASQRGAIVIDWDRRAGERTHVTRIQLKDRDALAQFVGIDPRWEAVARARETQAALMETYPLLQEVVARWEKGLKPRGTSLHQVQDWLDAIEVVKYCRNCTQEDIPVRRLSALMLGDSKRIESLYSVVDAVWQNNLAAPHRTEEEVFSEMGLVKYPPTFLIAGNAEVLYGGVTAPVLAPYIGFAPSVIDGFRIDPTSIGVLTVENLTTFHELATRRAEYPDLLILYTGGMPSRSWVVTYRKLLAALPGAAGIWHWGDIDGGGFRIANRIAGICCDEGCGLKLHMMGSGIPDGPGAVRHKMSASEVGQIRRICEKHGWQEELKWVERIRLAVEQECLPINWPHKSLHIPFV